MGRLVITIARSYGSGGRTMGQLLAKELGINYYDRELVRMASDKSGINEALFGEVDERVKQMITLLTGMMPTQIPSEEEQNERLTLMQEIMDLVNKTNTDYESMLNHYGVESDADMTTEQLRDAKEVLEKKL